MKPIFKALRPFIHSVIRQAWLVLVVALLVSAAGLYGALHLRIDTDLAKLLPADQPNVQALETLRNTVGGESTAAVAIESPSFEANKRFAEALIPRVLNLQGASYEEPYFTRVDYRQETEFLANNALYFATSQELDQTVTYLKDQIEQAKLEANPFYFDVEEDEPGADTTAAQLQGVYQNIVGKEYPISEDSTTMVLRFYPAGAQTNMRFIDNAYEDLDKLVEKLNPSSFHPEMRVVLAGGLLRRLVEVRTIQRDVFGSFGAGVGSVLLFVTLYFLYKAYSARAGRHFSGRILLSEVLRAPVMGAVVGLPLLMSLTWTFGVAYLTFGTLNLMTSTLGLVLFGLGIDFGIHFYARYAEERGEGRSLAKAIETTFDSTGQAIAVGAMTTAAALYVLTAADFKGFSEFGFIAGTGILFALIAMIVVLPALLIICEQTGLLNMEAMPLAVRRRKTKRRFPGARGIVAGSLAAVVAALVLLPPEFEYDFGKLEPEYEQFNEKRRLVRRVYGGGSGMRKRNPAYIVVDDRSEVPEVMRALQEKIRQDTLSPTVYSIESLQDRFPLRPSKQQAKLDRIAEVRELLSNKFLRNETSEGIERLRQAAQTRTPVDTSEVPAYLKKRFTTKSGEIGNFIMIYPSVGLSDGRKSIAFTEDIGKVVTEDGDVYYAASTSIVAARMLQLIRQEAPWMIGATFLIVALLMWFNFRSLKWAGLALLPLVVGILWMLLVMELLGVSLNFYNMVVLPAVLGIGNDAGVHLVHRYQEEGFGSIRRVLRSTGEHVTMGSLTTMIGFAGLLLSFHPGLNTIGELAVIGIGTTLLSSLLFLPALIQWMEDRQPNPPAEEAPAQVQHASAESAELTAR